MSAIRQKITAERQYRIGVLKGQAESLKKICEGLIEKIEKDGIDAYYSVNIGANKIAASISDTCRCLYFLKTWEDTLDKHERAEDQNRQGLRGQDTSRAKDSRQGDQD
jgi:hypothetical protein